MLDYCMCKGTGCTQRNKCYRFRMKPMPVRQSYLANVPGSGDECEYFSPIEEWADHMLTELEPNNEDGDLATIESPIHDQSHN